MALHVLSPLKALGGVFPATDGAILLAPTPLLCRSRPRYITHSLRPAKQTRATSSSAFECHLQVSGPGDTSERGESRSAGAAGTPSASLVSSRRGALVSGAWASTLLSLPLLQIPAAHAATVSEEPGTKEGSGSTTPLSVPSELKGDALNAYEFRLPLKLTGGTTLSWVESRKPERYSSAAPLAPDARLRIVAESLDYRHSLVCSVYVGPPNPAFLAAPEPGDWSATGVARSVLADKNSTRMTVEQRVQETIIGDSRMVQVDGTPYWYFEYLAQKSPSTFSSGVENYRHSLAVSATREGYLYTLNVSTLSSLWDEAEPALRDAIRSFRLLPPTRDYVPPWKDPWRFW